MATVTKATTPEATREHVLSLIRAINSHDVDAMVAHFTDDVLWDDPGLRTPVTGLGAASAQFSQIFTTFPDYHLPLEEVDVFVADDGKKAVAKWRAVATMTGPMDPPGFAPTGKTSYFLGVCLYEMRDGLIARHTILYDTLSVAEKLGLMPGFDSLPVKALAQTQRLVAGARRAILRR